MSSVIETVTYAEGDKKSLKLANADWVRTLSIGNNWSTLRIGLLLRVEDSGANQNPAAFRVGVQSGATQYVGGGGDMDNHFGLCIGRDLVSRAQMNYTADGTYGNYYGANYMGITRKVNNNLEIYGYAGGLPKFASSSAAVAERKTPFVVQIEKGTPNYTIRWWGCDLGSSTFNRNYTYPQLDDSMSQSGLALTIDGVAFSHQNVNTTFAISESNGNLDSIFMFSENTAYPFHVAYLAVKKIA